MGKVGFILAYLRSIFIVFAIWIPIAYLLDFIFDFLQIPFTMMHRYIVLLIKVYLQSFILNMVLFLEYSLEDLSPYPFLIIFLSTLLVHYFDYFKNKSDESSKEFGVIACVSSLFFFLISQGYVFPPFLYLFQIAVCPLYSFINYNNLTLWITYILGFMAFAFTVIKMVLYVRFIYYKTHSQITSAI